MKYNKHFLNKVDDKKHLRKVKKQWVVVSMASFALVTGGGLAVSQINHVLPGIVPTFISNSVNHKASADTTDPIPSGLAQGTYSKDNVPAGMDKKEFTSWGMFSVGVSVDGSPAEGVTHDTNTGRDVHEITFQRQLIVDSTGAHWGDWTMLTSDGNGDFQSILLSGDSGIVHFSGTAVSDPNFVAPTGFYVGDVNKLNYVSTTNYNLTSSDAVPVVSSPDGDRYQLQITKTTLDTGVPFANLDVKAGIDKLKSDYTASPDFNAPEHYLFGYTVNFTSKTKDTTETKTFTRTIKYVDQSGNEVKSPKTESITLSRKVTTNLYTNKVTTGDWTVDGTNGWADNTPVDQTITDSNGNVIYDNPKLNGAAVTSIPGKTADEINGDETDTVVYGDHTSSVTPDTPNLPDNIKKQLEQDVTRTIHYRNAANHAESVHDDVVQHATAKFSAQYDWKTGELVKNSSGSVDKTLIQAPTFDGQADPTVAGWKFVSHDSADSDPTTNYTEGNNGDVNPNISNIESYSYYDKTSTIGPNGPVNPNDPVIPDNKKDTVKNDLSRTYHRMVTLKGRDGVVLGTKDETVTYTRTATFDYATGEIVPGSETAWTLSGSDNKWDEVTGDATIDHDGTHYIKESGADGTDPEPNKTFNPDTDASIANQEDTIWYDATAAPSATDTDKDVKRTIYFKADDGTVLDTKVQSVHFHRDGYINQTTNQFVPTSDWYVQGLPNEMAAVGAEDFSSQGYEPDTSKQTSVSALTPDKGDTSEPDQTIWYKDKTGNITPNTPKHNPNNGPDIPQGILDSLTKKVTRTIHYKGRDGQDLGDKVQTVTFKGSAEYDWKTQQLVGPITWDNGDGNWPANDAPATIQKDGATYRNPDQPHTDAQDVTINMANAEVTVLYDKTRDVVPSDNADTDRDKVRTFHLLDGNDGNREFGTTKQTTHFHRDALYFDETTNQIVYGNWSADNDSKWAAYNAPDESDKGYVNGTPASYGEVALNQDSQNADENFVYSHAHANVGPNGPVNPGQGGHLPNIPDDVHLKDQLSKTITRTIKYVDKNGNEIAPEVTETVTYTRTADYDYVTHQLSNFSAWTVDGSDEWAEKDSPEISGYNSPDKAKVDAQKVAQSDQDQTVTVTYDKDAAPVTPAPAGPAGPSAPATPAAPASVPAAAAKVMKVAKAVLPSTGKEAAHDAEMALPFVATTLAGIFFLISKKRKEEQEDQAN